MDQIAQVLGLINSFRIEELSGSANPTQGARLNLDGKLGALRLTAADGSDPGIAIGSQGFGIRRLSLPTPQDPTVSLDPYLKELRIDLDDRFFARAAVIAKEPIVADMHQVINRVQVSDVEARIRLGADKVAHADVSVGLVTLLHDSEELIRISNLELSVIDFHTRMAPPVALKKAIVVLRGMRVEVEEQFFESVLGAVSKKVPHQLEKLDIELLEPRMVIDGKARVKIPISFRVDLRLETENDMFGIYFDRFYVPGTNVKLPGFARNMLLGLIRTFAEEKLRGLVEISNESMRVNPWVKIPLDLRKRVRTFAVEKGRIVLEFVAPPEGQDPGTADDQARRAQNALLRDTTPVVAPGPAL